jgi:hypothetical protein
MYCNSESYKKPISHHRVGFLFVHKVRKQKTHNCYTVEHMKMVLSRLFVIAAFGFFAFPSYAATLYMDPNQGELKRGDTVRVSVRLDAGEEECVNVVDGVITYTENIQPIDISRGQSILTMWVEEPVINKENRTITFAGGIPNGYCGRIPGDPRLTNNVVDLIFQSPGLQIGNSESGNEVSIDFAQQTQVLLNDGFGSAAPLQLFGSKLQLSKEAGDVITNPWQSAVSDDALPPEKFSIALERTPNAYSNQFFIAFNTTDKQSGIDHYEVIEEPLASKNLFGWGAETAPWIEARSPYVLEDQSLNSTIRVKAIDKAGNEYIAVLIPPEASRSISFENILSIAAIAVFTLIVSAVCIYLYVRHKRRRNVGADIPSQKSTELPPTD